jgi:hypothetical protein
MNTELTKAHVPLNNEAPDFEKKTKMTEMREKEISHADHLKLLWLEQ